MMNQFKSRFLYNKARFLSAVGKIDQASKACTGVLELGDHRKVRMLLSGLELPGENYFNLLARMHDYLKPQTYIEIGVDRGLSMRLASPETAALGVDPKPNLKRPPGPNVRIFAQTSDDFFATHDVSAELSGKRLDLAFIDGMHQFEYALRDFIHMERLSSRESIILIHDCYPLDALSAARERSTFFWSGDIWRLILILKKYRPDLSVHTVAAPPTGLGVIFNLDSTSTVLTQYLSSIIAEGMAMNFGMLTGRKAEMLNLYPNDWGKVQELLDSRKRAA